MINTQNTYAWINTTANSKKESNVNAINLILIKTINELNKINKMCPAVMLAANRTDNVTGRISWLTISINTINTHKNKGVDTGNKWIINLRILTVILKIIKANQTKSVKIKVNNICDVNEKTYGKSPPMFISHNKLNTTITGPVNFV